MSRVAPDWERAAARAGAAAARWGAEGPGGAIVLFDAAGLRDMACGGLADLATGRPFEAATVGRLASVTKHVFCAFVLSQSDVIGLDDPLGAHLPVLPTAVGAITVGRALDMSGGVPDTREALTLLGHSVFTRSEAPALLAFHAGLDRPNYAPGTEVHYSNGGYRLVEEALRRHGRSFRDHMAGLSRTLGIDFAAWDYWTEPVPGLAPGYWQDGVGWQIGLQGMHLSAAGALSGSALGLAGWGRALLAGTGPLAGTLAALSARRRLTDGTLTDYGLGLRHQRLGAHELVGHGGSQPGYKSFLLLSPETGTGVAVLANRDDANTADIAAEVMAGLLGAARPAAASGLVPGLYVAPEGADWLEVGATTARRLDDETGLFDGGVGWSDSFAPTSRLRLRMAGDEITGTAGHAPVHYLPVTAPDLPPAHLDGLWQAQPFGALLSIRNGAVVMGSGPTRLEMPLRPLGQGRYLFTRSDAPWTRRICLCETGPNRFDLALSRARALSWTRIGD